MTFSLLPLENVTLLHGKRSLMRKKAKVKRSELLPVKVYLLSLNCTKPTKHNFLHTINQMSPFRYMGL